MNPEQRKKQFRKNLTHYKTFPNLIVLWKMPKVASAAFLFLFSINFYLN